MNIGDISISETGIYILSHEVGLSPLAETFEAVFMGDIVRRIDPINFRQLRVCDGKGLSWLIDLELNTVLWFRIMFAHGDHRNVVPPVEAKDCFQGKVHFGKYTVQGPFSFEIGEIIRNISIPKVQVELIPDQHKIYAALVSFSQNELKSERLRLSRQN